MNNEEVIVSIACITYNQEKYIRDCLDGFVMQETNFKFEIVIHDDASTDNTANIIREYVAKYPELFVPILQEDNKFKYGKGILVPYVYPHCRGKYIAYCEGDDYWTDPHKLQRQVDFLESHPDYSMCWCDGFQLDINGKLTQFNRYTDSLATPLEDVILKGGLWIPTASIVCRKEALNGWPPEGARFHVGDYPLQVHLADVGKTFYFKEPMMVYRYQAAGSWTAKAFANRDRQEEWFLKEFDMLDDLIKVTSPNCHHSLSQLKYKRLHSYYFFKGNYFKGVKYLFKISKGNRPKYSYKTHIAVVLGPDIMQRYRKFFKE